MSADLHSHTAASPDCSLSFDQRLSIAQGEEFDTIALTDRNFVHTRLRKTEENFGGINVVSGVEITCFGEEGKLNILGLFIDPETMREKLRKRYRMKYRHAIRSIHDAGGIAILAHPGRYNFDIEEVIEKLVEMRLDGIETVYPYNFHGFEDYERKAEQIAEKYGLATSGGSDCHGGQRKTMGKIRLENQEIDKLRQITGRYT